MPAADPERGRTPPIRGSLAAWDRFWFGEAPLLRLALFRIVVLATALWGLRYYGAAVEQHARGEAAAFLHRPWRPIYLFEALGIGPIGPDAFGIVSTILFVALGLGILGLFTRLSCLAAALLTFYWVGTFYSYGKPHHDFVALAFALFALPFAPVGARLSLGSALARWRRAGRGGVPEGKPEVGPWAGLPLRVTQVTLAVGYFFSGATKLVQAGGEWINGYTLQGMMLEFDAPWTPFFAQHRVPLVLISAGILLLQTTFPLVLAFPRLRWVYLPSAALFHVVAWKTMSTGPFVTLWFTFACFLELERVPGFLGRLLRTGPWALRLLRAVPIAAAGLGILSLYFLQVPEWLGLGLIPVAIAGIFSVLPSLRVEVRHDGACPACRRGMAVLSSLDWARRLRVGESGSLLLAAGSRGHRLEVLDTRGRARTGFEAFRALAMRLPLLFPLAPLLVLPSIPRLGRRLVHKLGAP
ncbi:MAG: HTTM domain-containing protein [Planctomycetes bacterium]|nr:HTTM domain-containing protein [Planctomycetota bacterium]